MYSGHTAEDRKSFLMTPDHKTNHSHLMTTAASVFTPSYSALQLNHMYLEAKMNMLRIIEQGLQLKLNIQDIRDKFLKLISDFEEYERMRRSPLIQPDLIELTTRQNVNMTPVQRRVWTFHELRRARIRAKHIGWTGRQTQAKKLRLSELTQEKENYLGRQVSNRRYREGKLECNLAVTSGAEVTNHLDRPSSTITWSIRKFLTPIREESSDKCSNTLVVYGKSPPQSSDVSQNTEGTSSTRTDPNWPAKPDLSVLKPDVRRRSHRRCSLSATEDPSADNWMISPQMTARKRSQSTSDILRSTQKCGALDQQSPVRTALSETVCRAYTNDSLKDISTINKTSEEDLCQPAATATSTSRDLDSTFNHPLHSTLDYPLHSTLNIDDTELAAGRSPTYARDASSELNHARANPSVERYDIDLSPLRQTTVSRCLSSSSSNNSCSSSCSSPVALRREFSPQSFRTPTKKPQAQLCKEHGIHPTFDGSCIFQNGDTPTLNSSDEELDPDENGNSAKVSSNVRETDCDSSYLSECLDERQTSADTDQYVATYDSRKACIRMLKRQTGQAKLSEVKQPIGLSESDLYCDIMDKHFSLEAMRSSLPDLSGLSTLPTSAAEDESSDMTLQASSTLKSGNMAQESMNVVLSPSDDTPISNDQRPVLSSTNEESPESNTAMPVPVNSPNVTDSGGSSSRQNTDNYEYMEMQPQQQQQPQQRLPTSSDRISLPGSHTTHSSKSCHSHRSQSLYSQHSERSSKSYQPHRRPSPVEHHRHRRRYASTPAQLFDARSARTTTTTKSRRSHQSGGTKHRSAVFPRPSAMCCRSGHDQSSQLDGRRLRHVGERLAPGQFTDNLGRQRTIVQHSPASQHLPKERKKALVKKLKHFSNSFYNGTSTGNLEIQTLGHF